MLTKIKKLSILVMAALLIISAFPAVVFADDEDNDIVRQNFDKYPIGGTSFPGISICNNGGGVVTGSVSVFEIVDGDNTDRVLKYAKTSSVTNVGFYTDLGTGIGIEGGKSFVLEMDVMFEKFIPNVHLIQGRKVNDNNSPEFMTFLKLSNGNFYTENGKRVAEGKVGVWYKIGLAVDDKARTYDVYIDGVLKEGDVPFSVNAKNFLSSFDYSCLRVPNLTSYASPVTMYVDDIALFYGTEPEYIVETDDGELDDEIIENEPLPDEDKEPEIPEEEEEEEEEFLFPADEIKPSASDKTGISESSTDKIYTAIIAALSGGTVIFFIISKKFLFK